MIENDKVMEKPIQLLKPNESRNSLELQKDA